MSITISTDRLISSSEARKKFGKMIDEIKENEGNYFVILENGKVAAVLVHPNSIKTGEEEFPNLEKLRKEWDKHSKEISNALEKIEKTSPKKLPKLLR